MMNLKTLVCAGLHYLESGSSDFQGWSLAMRDEFGEEVAPFLEDLWQNAMVIMYRKAGPQPNKLNCWEYHDCSRHGGSEGPNAYEVCPAATACRFDGIHGGRFGGRACWLVNDTLCMGGVQKTPREKRACCENCSFPSRVRQEEGPDRILPDESIDLILS